MHKRTTKHDLHLADLPAAEPAEPRRPRTLIWGRAEVCPSAKAERHRVRQMMHEVTRDPASERWLSA